MCIDTEAPILPVFSCCLTPSFPLARLCGDLVLCLAADQPARVRVVAGEVDRCRGHGGWAPAALGRLDRLGAVGHEARPARRPRRRQLGAVRRRGLARRRDFSDSHQDGGCDRNRHSVSFGRGGGDVNRLRCAACNDEQLDKPHGINSG